MKNESFVLIFGALDYGHFTDVCKLQDTYIQKKGIDKGTKIDTQRQDFKPW